MSPPRPRTRIDPAWAVAAGVLVGVFVAAFAQARTGMWLIAASLMVAALARLVLRQHDAGSLVVRSRELDVFVLTGLAVAIGLLAAFTPLPNVIA